MDEQRTVTVPRGGPGASDDNVEAPGVVVLFSEGTVGSDLHRGRPQTSVGRAKDQHVFVDDKGMSREHALLFFRGSTPAVFDRESRNGTFLNGVAVQGRQPASFGDIVRCGNTLFCLVPDIESFSGWPASALTPPLLGGPAIQAVSCSVEYLASQSTHVLITGESGTGKDVVARLLHQKSDRASGPLISLNCAAVPEALIESELFGATKGAYTGAAADRDGLIQQAHGGTLFLDELGEMPLPMQAKLLRVVEQGEVRRLGATRARRVDLRIVAATNRNLSEQVTRGSFREDLYHRIGGTSIQMPPLRTRRYDVILLANHFAAQVEHESGRKNPRMTADFVEALLCYHFPGNVRELQWVIRDALLKAAMERSSDLSPRHLKEDVTSAKQVAGELAEIRRALTQNGGNVVKAALELGIPRSRLYRILAENDLKASDFRR